MSSVSHKRYTITQVTSYRDYVLAKIYESVDKYPAYKDVFLSYISGIKDTTDVSDIEHVAEEMNELCDIIKKIN